MYHKVAKNYCTILGLGFVSKMPGTLGSLVGLLITGLSLTLINYYFLMIFLFIIFILSIIFIYVYQLKEGKSDKSEIIIDEFIGQSIVLLFFDVNFLNLLLAFILFRFFDIFKFFPVNYIDKKYSGPIGVIIDDILAAIQAIIVLYVIIYFIK